MAVVAVSAAMKIVAVVTAEILVSVAAQILLEIVVEMLVVFEVAGANAVE